MNYLEFIQSKTAKTHEIGFVVDPATLGHKLMPFQAECVARCLKWGRGLIAADCGLGKTPMQLVWAEKMHEHTGRDVLIFAPLAVAQQTQREGVKFGVPVKVCRTQADVVPGVNITNYEMIEHFDPAHFGALVLDESGILKGYGSKTRKALGKFTDCIPYRLCCTATPAPNDLIEIINHAEFLGVMQGKEIIATYFIQDGNTTHKWRLKGHAMHDFWAWVSSWAIAVRRPSDLGFENGAFVLPALNIIQHTVDGHINEGFLTPMEAQTLMERAQARRESKDERVAKAAELANSTDRPFLVWCDLNSESDALKKMIPGSVEVRGSDSIEWKVAAAEWFQGNKCICKTSEFRAKLSVCQNKNTTQSITESTTRKTAQNELRNQQHMLSCTKKKNEHTTQSIKGKTGRKSKNRASNTGNELDGMQKDENDMQKIQSLLGKKSKTGTKTILNPSSEIVSRSLESHSKSTTKCSQSKAVDAQSADAQTAAMQEKQDYALTTATRQILSEDCCATTAIKQSESSQTIQNCSNEPQCICGYQSGKKVLISKPSIFGFGLNFQICADMAFVGLSDSFERYYQAVRRCWRFGQTKPVNAHIICAETEGAVVANIERKERESSAMMEQIVMHMNEDFRLGRRNDAPVVDSTLILPSWLKGVS